MQTSIYTHLARSSVVLVDSKASWWNSSFLICSPSDSYLVNIIKLNRNRLKIHHCINGNVFNGIWQMLKETHPKATLSALFLVFWRKTSHYLPCDTNKNLDICHTEIHCSVTVILKAHQSLSSLKIIGQCWKSCLEIKWNKTNYTKPRQAFVATWKSLMKISPKVWLVKKCKEKICFLSAFHNFLISNPCEQLSLIYFPSNVPSKLTIHVGARGAIVLFVKDSIFLALCFPFLTRPLLSATYLPAANGGIKLNWNGGQTDFFHLNHKQFVRMLPKEKKKSMWKAVFSPWMLQIFLWFRPSTFAGIYLETLSVWSSAATCSLEL